MDKLIQSSIARCVAHLARENQVTQDEIWEAMFEESKRHKGE